MDFQQIMILGRATKDAEYLTSKDGDKKYGKISVAVNEYHGKEKGEDTTFYDVLIFNKTAEKVAKIKKGNSVLVQGTSKANAYINKKGEAVATMSIFARKWNQISK